MIDSIMMKQKWPTAVRTVIMDNLLIYILGGSTLVILAILALNIVKNKMPGEVVTFVHEAAKPNHYVLRKKDFGSFLGILSPLEFHDAVAAFAESQYMIDGDIVQAVRENIVLDMLVIKRSGKYDVQMISSMPSGMDVMPSGIDLDKLKSDTVATEPPEVLET